VVQHDKGRSGQKLEILGVTYDCATLGTLITSISVEKKADLIRGVGELRQKTDQGEPLSKKSIRSICGRVNFLIGGARFSILRHVLSPLYEATKGLVGTLDPGTEGYEAARHAFHELHRRIRNYAGTSVSLDKLSRGVRIFTDASGTHVGGIAIYQDGSERRIMYFSEAIPDALHEKIAGQNKVLLTEAIAALIAVSIFQPLFVDRVCHIWVDNKGVMLSIIKGASRNGQLQNVATEFLRSVEIAVVRDIPSVCNPADGLTRPIYMKKILDILGADAVRVRCDPLDWIDALGNRLLSGCRFRPQGSPPSILSWSSGSLVALRVCGCSGDPQCPAL